MTKELDILAIGSRFNHKTVKTTKFRGNRALLDYSVILFDLKSCYEEFEKGTYPAEVNGSIVTKWITQFSQEEYQALNKEIKAYQQMLKESAEQGSTLITFLPIEGIELLQIFEEILYQSTTGLEIELAQREGSKIQECYGEPFTSFFEKNPNAFKYEICIPETFGSSIFKINGTSLVVGSYFRINNANLILLPTLKNDKDIEAKFIDSLPDLVKALTTPILYVNNKDETVRFYGVEIKLTPKEFNFLYLLAKNAGELISYEQLTDKQHTHSQDKSVNESARKTKSNIIRKISKKLKETQMTNLEKKVNSSWPIKTENDNGCKLLIDPSAVTCI